MIEVLIFSRDRAAQLDLLLSSLKQYWRDWESQRLTVLYMASTVEFEQGYDLVRAIHGDVLLANEQGSSRSFKDQLLELLGHAPYTAFFVDDNVFKARLQLDDPAFGRFAQTDEIAALSLRMAPGMDYCYPADLYAPPPPMEADLVWRWVGQAGDWGYPMSLDGHVFRSSDIIPAIAGQEFRNPNTLETELARHPLDRPKLICLPEAPVVNIPANRVQDANFNRHGGGSAERLNRMFVAGARLDPRPFAGIHARSPHADLPLRWQGIKGRVQGTESPRQRMRRLVRRFSGRRHAGQNYPSASETRE